MKKLNVHYLLAVSLINVWIDLSFVYKVNVAVQPINTMLAYILHEFLDEEIAHNFISKYVLVLTASLNWFECKHCWFYYYV